MENNVLDKLYKYRYIMLFIFLCAIFYFIPYTADDLRWGGFYGEKRLNNLFHNYGGRYLGYLLSIGLTRSIILKTLFMSAVTAGIVYYIEKISRQKCAFFITLILMATAPSTLFRQSIAWLSGFVNYSFSAFLALIFIDYIYKLFRCEETKDTRTQIVLFAFLGFASALLVEHFTIYCIVIAIGAMIYAKVNKQKLRRKNISYLAGLTAGAVVMFSNTAYRRILAGNDFYRGIMEEDDDKPSEFFQIIITIFKQGLLQNIVLCVLMLIVITALFAVAMSLLKKKEKIIGITAIVITGIVYGFDAVIFMINREISDLPDGVQFAAGFAVLICMWIVIIMLARKLDRLWEALFCMFSVITLSVPFIFVHPLTVRCMFGVYMIYVLQICLMFDMLPQKYKDRVNSGISRLIYTTALIAAFIFYLVTYISVSNADQVRLADIKKAYSEGVRTLQIRHLPDENFVHMITPKDKEYQVAGYKDFYDLPDDLTIKGQQ